MNDETNDPSAAPQPSGVSSRVSQEDDPYIAPPLKIAFTVKVRVKHIGKLPVMPYPIDDQHASVES
jgi:hypothetical protein